MDWDALLENEEYTWRDMLLEVIRDMDPWDIDLVELASRYSKKVEEMRRMNFRIPANVLVLSSVLLRMKADILSNVNPFQEAIADEDREFFAEFDFQGFWEPSKVSMDHEHEGDGKAEVPLTLRPKRVPKRKITALELIAAIQEVLEEKRAKKRWIEARKREKMVVNLEREFGEIIQHLYERLKKLLKGKEAIEYHKIASTREEVIATFIPLLYLWSKEKLQLLQKHLYGEIIIKLA